MPAPEKLHQRRGRQLTIDLQMASHRTLRELDVADRAVATGDDLEAVDHVDSLIFMDDFQSANPMPRMVSMP